MKKLMIVSTALVAVAAQAGWGDFGNAAAKDATAATLKGLSGSKADEAKRAKCDAKPCNDAEMAEKAKKDEVSKKQIAEKEQNDAAAANVPGFIGKKVDWKSTNIFGRKNDYHVRVASGSCIENPREGLYQLQVFLNDDMGFKHMGFSDLSSLEYGIDRLDEYVKKCLAWEKIAIDNSVYDLRKEDEKTRFAIDKAGKRIEWWIFCTRKDLQDKTVGYFDYRSYSIDGYDNFMRTFAALSGTDESIAYWQKFVDASRKAVELYKTGLEESVAEGKRLKNAESLFN